MISSSQDRLTITGDTTGAGRAPPSESGRPATLKYTSVFYEREAAGLAVRVGGGATFRSSGQRRSRDSWFINHFPLGRK